MTSKRHTTHDAQFLDQPLQMHASINIISDATMKVTTRSSRHSEDGAKKNITPTRTAASTTITKQKRSPSGPPPPPPPPPPTPKKSWNTMEHLSLKRFADDDPTLTAGARRDRTVKHPYVARAERDPSGRAVCKLCGERIPKDALRLSLMLECHKGYRNQCTLHEDCFWKHPETKKLTSVDEIVIGKGLDDAQTQKVKDCFEAFRQQSKSDVEK